MTLLELKQVMGDVVGTYRLFRSWATDPNKHHHSLTRALCPSDYVCEVELIGKRMLPPAEYRFLRVYILEDMPGKHEGTYEFVTEYIRVLRKVAPEWVRRGLYPAWRYTHEEFICWSLPKGDWVAPEKRALTPAERKRAQRRRDAMVLSSGLQITPKYNETLVTTFT
jgi:hypothetical protein